MNGIFIGMGVFFFVLIKAQLWEIEYVLSVRLPWEVLLGVASWFALTC